MEEPVVVGIDDEDAGYRDRSRDDASAEGAAAEVFLQLLVAVARRVGGEIDGGQVGTVATARTPMKIEVGFSQLENRCPAAFPTGTRSVAIPPIAAPSANGVRIEESEKIVSISRASRALDAPAFSA